MDPVMDGRQPYDGGRSSIDFLAGGNDSRGTLEPAHAKWLPWTIPGIQTARQATLTLHAGAPPTDRRCTMERHGPSRSPIFFWLLFILVGKLPRLTSHGAAPPPQACRITTTGKYQATSTSQGIGPRRNIAICAAVTRGGLWISSQPLQMPLEG
jgi:hypothetical protein